MSKTPTHNVGVANPHHARAYPPPPPAPRSQQQKGNQRSDIATGADDVLPPRRTHPAFQPRGAAALTAAPPRKSASQQHHNHPRRADADNNERTNTGGFHNSSNTLFSVRHGKRIFNREIAFLMLVVAAQTMAEIGSIGAGVLSTEVMADAYGFAERPSVDGDGYQQQFCYNSYTTTMPGGKFISFSDAVSGATSLSTCKPGKRGGDKKDEDEEEKKGKRLPSLEELRALTSGQQPVSSASVTTLTSARASETNDKLSSDAQQRQAFLRDAAVWDRVLEFLPWREVMEVRRSNRFMMSRSLGFAAVMRMPNTKQPALFIPCREDLDADEATVEAALRASSSSNSKGAYDSATSASAPWTCNQCGLFNDASSLHCGTAWCAAPRPSTSCRMFLGQLRRTGTVKMVEWLMNYVFDAPPGALLSVENHRNTTTGRGKGCAWPTIADDATVNRMLQTHHRLFYDRIGGVEGVWLVRQGQESLLQAETDAPARGGRNHLKYMPRNLMVFELPAGQQRPAMRAMGHPAVETVGEALYSAHGMMMSGVSPMEAAVAEPAYWYGAPHATTPLEKSAKAFCPAPRSAQLQWQLQQQPQASVEEDYTTPPTTAIKSLEESNGASTRSATNTPNLSEDLSSHSADVAPLENELLEEEPAVFARHYDASTARVYVAPNVYRHHPYGPLTFQL